MNQDFHDGGCLCGEVRYRLSGTPLSSQICHCVSCRLAAGAQSVAYLTVSHENFTSTSGEPLKYHSSPEVTRTFCGKCGTSLTYEHEEDQGSLDVNTATLDLPGEFPPTFHVWMEDKVGWESVEDSLPQFQQSSLSG